MEGITVKDLIKKLKKFPEDYKINLHIEYQNLGDFGGQWSTMWTDDIDSFESDDENKTVTIKAYE